MSKQSKSETLPIRPSTEVQPADDEPVTISRRRRKKRRRSRILKLFTSIRRHFRFRIAFIIIITIAVSAAMVISVRISDATNRLDASWQRLDRVLNSIAERQGADIAFDEYPRIRLGVNDVQSNIRSTQSQLKLVAPLLEYNEEWEISAQLLNVASELTTGTRYLLDGIGPVVNFLSRDEDSSTLTTQISVGEQVLDLLDINQGSFVSASESLNQAKDLLNAIDLSAVPSDLTLSHQELTDLHEKLNVINSVFLSSSDILSHFMGLEEEATYLILAQNNDSLRPSGGKIEAYGWFSVRNGRITGFDFSPSTFSRPIPPNSSYVNNFSIPSWWLAYENQQTIAWNGSWHVSFPSTAQMALDYYNNGNNINSPVDGIIAIDFLSLEQIVGVLGEVELPDMEDPLTMSNFRKTIYDPENFKNQGHEQYVASIYNIVFGNLQDANQNQSEALLTVLLEGLIQHHIMVYVPNPEIQDVIDLLDWSGVTAEAGSNDYLLIADTNLVNKSNHSIVRSLTYDVEVFPDQSHISSLSVRYDYFDSLAVKDPAIDPIYFGPRDYKTLTQIHLPAGTVVLEEENTIESSVVESGDHTLFVTQHNVEYDTSDQFKIVYQTPATSDRVGNLYRYRLLVEKQLGLQIQDLELQVKLPPNANVVWFSQNPVASYTVEQPVFDFRLHIIADQWIEILYRLD